MIPFTVDQFLNVFERYNIAVWPAQLILYLLGLCAISRFIDFTTISLAIISGSILCVFG